MQLCIALFKLRVISPKYVGPKLEQHDTQAKGGHMYLKQSLKYMIYVNDA